MRTEFPYSIIKMIGFYDRIRKLGQKWLWNVFCTFKMSEEKLNILARHIENAYIKVQIKFYRWETSEMKNSMGWNNNGLQTVEEKK